MLCTLLTKHTQRKRGAGSMLVRWGVERAKRDGVPAFLEATPAGAPIYESLGFRQVGQAELQLQQFGFAEPIVLARMAANLA